MDAFRKRIGTLTDDVERFDRSPRAIRTDDEELLWRLDVTQEFYELRNDPEEATNFATDHPERIDALETTLDTIKHVDTSGEVLMTDATEARLRNPGYLQ